MLVVGGRVSSAELVDRLSAQGFLCAAADAPESVLAAAAALSPEAILLSADEATAAQALACIRTESSLRDVPVLADLSRGSAEGLRALSVDDFVHSHDELTRRLEAALRAKRLVDREQRSRLRMELLLEITEAAGSTLELSDVLNLAVEKIGRAIPSDRCSVVLVEGSATRTARVVASRAVPNFAPLQLDLARYPELRRALETRRAVHVEDVARDPLMDEVRKHLASLEVRSILVQPLMCSDDLFGALTLRLSGAGLSFAREDREFAQAAATALSNSIRNARLHAALKRKREDLESAYVDRYRELAEANQRLKESSRFKDDLIAVCSHDLRAPLQVLLGHAQLLLDGGLSAEEQRSVEAISRVSRKVAGLVESLLERGRGDRARIALDPQSLDVSELCQESAAELSILAAERGVALRSEAPESLMAVGDEVKLRQVLQNLVTNAIRHAAEPGGQVVVRAQRLERPDGDVARVVVQDDGLGLAPDQMQLVFDKYRHDGSGVGLGLAICKELVELHGGEIWAERPTAGGCAFVFTVPLKEGRLAAAAEPAAAGDVEPPLTLLVEDEPDIAAVIAEMLRTRYRVEIARDGEEGLAKAHSLKPDLVLMDVFLPKLDGLDAAMAMKSSADTAQIPVIFLSAHQGVAEKVRALNLGAVDYLAKPFQSLELLTRVERVLRQRVIETELLRSRSMLWRAGSDADTGLYNRAGLIGRIEQEVARASRYGRSLSVAVLRPVTPSPDKARQGAAAVRQCIRVPDVAGHLGDAVFGVVLPEAGPQAARGLVARLAPLLRAETGLDYVSAVADLLEPGQTAEALLDLALAEAGTRAGTR